MRQRTLPIAISQRIIHGICVLLIAASVLRAAWTLSDYHFTSYPSFANWPYKGPLAAAGHQTCTTNAHSLSLDVDADRDFILSSARKFLILQMMYEKFPVARPLRC